MAKSVMLTRDEGGLLVDMLEHNYKTGVIDINGIGANLAAEIREIFGMDEQPDIKFASEIIENL